MYKITFLLLCIVTFVSSKFLEDKIDLTVKIDFQGLKRRLNENETEDNVNKAIVDRINRKKLVEEKEAMASTESACDRITNLLSLK